MTHFRSPTFTGANRYFIGNSVKYFLSKTISEHAPCWNLINNHTISNLRLFKRLVCVREQRRAVRNKGRILQDSGPMDMVTEEDSFILSSKQIYDQLSL